MSVIALAIALIALVLALLVPSPPAPGAMLAHNAVGGPAGIGVTCTHYPPAEVTLALPGSGTIVVSATVGVGIRHEFGIDDEARIVVARAPTECTLNNYTAFVSVPATVATDPFHFETVPLLRPFSISAAGTYTFYVNGVMARGFDPGDRFDSASLVAAFYPT